jgi:UDP-N-acetylmuramoylalanine--D-glutamate ligase
MKTLSDLSCLVLGLGETGLAMVRHLTRQGARVRVADSRPQAPGADEVRAIAGVELILGAFDERLLDGVSLVAISPGLTLRQPLIEEARARGIEIVGEIELFARALAASGQSARLVAITGTNGKTTTTTLVGELCRAAGLETSVAGNISPAALAEWIRREDAGVPAQAWVLELSSFQLETTYSLAPDAATVLNISDDHLDRYDDLADYARTKAEVFANAAVQVLNREDSRVAAMARAGLRTISFGLDAPASADDYGLLEVDGESWLARGDKPLIARARLQLAGQHNVANALAALALVHALDLPEEAVLEALAAFRGLSHRVEAVARRADGVVFYDDSKGTNVGATVAALEGLGRKVVLIAGGDGKGQDFGPLRESFSRHARAVVLIGRDARLIAEAVAGCGVELVTALDMAAAVVLANRLATSADAVMLSPACASFDMFRSYAHRAQVYCAAVHALPGVVKL